MDDMIQYKLCMYMYERGTFDAKAKLNISNVHEKQSCCYFTATGMRKLDILIGLYNVYKYVYIYIT